MLAHRPGTTAIWAQFTPMSATVARLRRFSGECCFQVIYFNCSFSFSPPCRVSPKARLATIGLTHAVKNTWASRFWGGFNQFSRPWQGGRSGGEDVEGD